jgi:hypothetical protein
LVKKGLNWVLNDAFRLLRDCWIIRDMRIGALILLVLLSGCMGKEDAGTEKAAVIELPLCKEIQNCKQQCAVPSTTGLTPGSYVYEAQYQCENTRVDPDKPQLWPDPFNKV